MPIPADAMISADQRDVDQALQQPPAEQVRHRAEEQHPDGHQLDGDLGGRAHARGGEDVGGGGDGQDGQGQGQAPHVGPAGEPSVPGADQLPRPGVDAALQRPFRDQVPEDAAHEQLPGQHDREGPQERGPGRDQADREDRVDADDGRQVGEGERERRAELEVSNRPPLQRILGDRGLSHGESSSAMAVTSVGAGYPVGVRGKDRLRAGPRGQVQRRRMPGHLAHGGDPQPVE